MTTSASTPEPGPLCIGGSFNPPHNGHLITARAVAEQLGFARARLVVAAQPPHKPGDADILEPGHRVQMCRLAVADEALFEVDDRETRRSGPSYTIDTAREMQQEPPYHGRPVPWLIGADLLEGLPHWHEARTLLEGEVVSFIVMRRPGFEIPWETLPEGIRRLREQVVEVPQLDISATDIRQRVQSGRSIRYLVPESVQQYIAEYGVYR